MSSFSRKAGVNFIKIQLGYLIECQPETQLSVVYFWLMVWNDFQATICANFFKSSVKKFENCAAGTSLFTTIRVYERNQKWADSMPNGIGMAGWQNQREVFSILKTFFHKLNAAGILSQIDKWIYK